MYILGSRISSPREKGDGGGGEGWGEGRGRGWVGEGVGEGEGGEGGGGARRGSKVADAVFTSYIYRTWSVIY